MEMSLLRSASLRNVGQHTPGQHVFLFSYIMYRKSVNAQIITSVSLAVDFVECYCRGT